MKWPEKLDELERLEKAMSEWPWEYDGNIHAKDGLVTTLLYWPRAMNCIRSGTGEGNGLGIVALRNAASAMIERMRRLEELVGLFVRKGNYHMEQWPGDKEMRAAIEKACALLDEVVGRLTAEREELK